MKHFKYTNKETDYLKKRDPVLGKEIERLGMIKREVNPDLFASLISSIVSQQVSIKAAETVYNRLVDLLGEVKPENIIDLDLDSIQKCGMSLRKANYIKEIAVSAINKIVDFANLSKLSDEDVINELVKLKGVGEWTAEMLLIHSLGRLDVLSYKDLGIRRGMMKLYNLNSLAREEFNLYKEKYSPYSTIASFYLWEISKQD